MAADSIFGHTAVSDVISCGAIDQDDRNNDNIETFSSRGPVTMLTETRQKTDISGIDGVAVTGAGGFSNPFYGTSAAAPHIAAIAALLESRFSSMPSNDIGQLIFDNAVDLGSAGYDNVFGYGRCDALASALSYLYVDFNSMGGTAVESQFLENGSYIEKPTGLTNGDLVVADWYLEEEYINVWDFAVDTVTADTTLYAKWGTPCTVTFDSMGGSAVDSQIVGEGGRVIEPSPAKTGYELLGWFMEEECMNQWDFDVDTVAGDITLYALWGEMLDGSGTQEDPYLIDDEIDLFFVAHMVNINNPSFENKYYLQTADIDLSQFSNWTPIGWETAFSGYYDGGGHTISNLNIDINIMNCDNTLFPDRAPTIGLFGWVSGIISNMDLTGGTISIYGYWRSANVGSIAGYLDGGNIQNCNSSVDMIGNVYSDSDFLGPELNFGGIVGYMDDYTEVRNCDNSGTISATGHTVRIGGIVGDAYKAAINNCINSGPLSVSSSEVYNLRIGGVAARVEATDFSSCNNFGSIIVLGAQENSRIVGGIVAELMKYTSTLTDCANAGDITYDDTRVVIVGGLIGYISDDAVEVTCCYNIGGIHIQSAEYIEAGGIIGGVSSTSRYGAIVECYNAGYITIENAGLNRTSIGGLVGYNCTEALEMSDCFNRGNIGCSNSSVSNDILHIGGLVGYANYTDSTYTNCYNTGGISEIGRFGGIIGSVYDDPDSVFFNCYYADTCPAGIGYSDLGGNADAVSSQTIAELMQQATFTGFDFTNTWGINENEDFPYLQAIPYPGAAGISIPETLILDIGSSATLTPVFDPADAADKRVTWSTSDESIATVSEDGEVTLLADGTATITVTTVDGGFTDTCEVLTRVPATGVSLDITSLEVEQCKSATLTATVSPDEATNKGIIWSSSNEDIAVVTDGTVEGIGRGTATITATTEDGGFSAVCEVTVTKSEMDYNDDGAVDMLDVIAVAQNYGIRASDGTYDPIYDLNDDGIINLFDLILITRYI